jgi:arylsulfatase A-like enzyme
MRLLRLKHRKGGADVALPTSRRRPGRVPLSPGIAVLLAIAFGLCAGYLDVGIIVLKKLLWNEGGYYRIARDFPWSVPAAHAALMLLPGLAIAAMSRLRPGAIPLGAGCWFLAALAACGALLRLPLYGAGSLLLAVGIGRLVGDAVAARGASTRRVGFITLGLLGVLGVLAAGSAGRQALRESRAVAGLPPAPRSRNVVLLVWDTVRARSLSLHGSPRETTPNLDRWAEKGVQYDLALAPAPWTFPSHSCFFTGQWPWRLDTQWNYRLDAPVPTLAEYLAARGYQTAGFAANTNWCTYESRLDRGFLHYEDYSQSPLSLLARTVHGQWAVTRLLNLGGLYFDEMWVTLQSRDAVAINGAFLDWLGRRRSDRPFFAYLNYFDAHDPYIPPAGFAGRFGIRPGSRRDFELLRDFVGLNKYEMSRRDLLMARDCYDDCVAYLDDQLGRLLDELQRRGLLADTDVILTADHGESFGEHGSVGHSYTVFLEEIHVPLVILSPDAPAGQQVFRPVSLRDLPATVVDRLGLADGSPFPGRSLAAYWGRPPGQRPGVVTSPAFTERVDRSARGESRPQFPPGGQPPPLNLSLVSSAYHYMQDGEGKERFHDLRSDPLELVNLAAAADHAAEIRPFRRELLELMDEDRGSDEIERAYLEAHRRSLRTLVRKGDARQASADPRVAAEDADRSGRPGS